MEFIIIDVITGVRADWIEEFNRTFATHQEADDALYTVMKNSPFRHTLKIKAIGDDTHKFDLRGEDAEGDYIEFSFIGTIEEARIECRKTLEFCGGGYLDIFDEDGQFIEDYEEQEGLK